MFRFLGHAYVVITEPDSNTGVEGAFDGRKFGGHVCSMWLCVCLCPAEQSEAERSRALQSIAERAEQIRAKLFEAERSRRCRAECELQWVAHAEKSNCGMFHFLSHDYVVMCTRQNNRQIFHRQE